MRYLSLLSQQERRTCDLLGPPRDHSPRAQPIGQAAEAVALGFHLVAACEYCSREILSSAEVGASRSTRSLETLSSPASEPQCPGWHGVLRPRTDPDEEALGSRGEPVSVRSSETSD